MPLSPEWGRAVVECLRSLEPQAGSGVKILRTSRGALIVADPVRGGVKQAGSKGLYPFDVTLVDLVVGTSKTASIRPGSINNLIPSNYTTTYPLLNSTTYYLVLSVTVTAGVVTGATLSMPTTAPVGMPVALGAPPTAFTVLLGAVIAGAWYRTIGNGSLQATSAEAFRVSRSSPAPGTLPYDLYYTWGLTNV